MEERELPQKQPDLILLRRDLRSKILDGLLPAVVLYLLLMLILFGLGPIRALFGGPGLLVYVLGLLGVAMFSLQRSLALGLSETTRAWYGMAGGVLAWAVVQISGMLEPATELGLREVVLLILVALVGALLWRQSLPLGVRFFWITFCANWSGSLFLFFLERVADWSPVLTLLYRLTGYAAAMACTLVVAWMLLRSQRRIQRIWASLVIVLSAVLAALILS
jgi:hypothetical protein